MIIKNNSKFRRACILFCLFLFICIKVTAQEKTGSVTDIDGNVYKTIKIGDQWWMAENLRVTKNPEGNPIKSYIYKNIEENEKIFGRLYSWDVAMNGSREEGVQGIAPDGWHIPNDSDWEKLFSFLGGVSVAGGKMKEDGVTHWDSPNEGATNSSDFTGLSAGGYSMGMFEGLRVGTHFWSSTEKGSDNTIVPSLHAESSEVLLFDVKKTFHHSIRCVKNK
jgi:uncharacterized protein (TIGR02145 family)